MSRVDTVDICRCKMMYSQLWDVKMLILADWELLSDLKSFYSKARVGHQRVAVQIPRRQFSMTRCTWCWIAVDWISLLQVGLSENIWKWDIPSLPNYHISSTYHQHIIIYHHVPHFSFPFSGVYGIYPVYPIFRQWWKRCFLRWGCDTSARLIDMKRHGESLIFLSFAQATTGHKIITCSNMLFIRWYW